MNYSLEHVSALLDAGERLSLVNLPDVRISRFLRLSLGADRQPFALVTVDNSTSLGYVLEVERCTRLLVQLVFASSRLPEPKINTAVGLFFTSSDESDVFSIVCGARQQVPDCTILYSNGTNLGTYTIDGRFVYSIGSENCSPSELLSIWSDQTDSKFVELESVIYTSSMLSGWLLRQACGFVSDLSSLNLRSNYQFLIANGLIRENCKWKSPGN